MYVNSMMIGSEIRAAAVLHAIFSIHCISSRRIQVQVIQYCNYAVCMHIINLCYLLPSCLIVCSNGSSQSLRSVHIATLNLTV